MDDEFHIKKRKIVETPKDAADARESPPSNEGGAAAQIRKRIAQFDFKPENTLKEILEECARNAAAHATLSSIIGAARKELRDRQNHWSKRKAQLAVAYLTENEFRERERRIALEESEDLRDIQIDILQKLTVCGVNGFETAEAFVERNFAEWKGAIADSRLARDVERILRANQLYVLNKLIQFSFFAQNEPNVVEQNSASKAAPIARDEPIEVVYNGRETKHKVVKLSKYVNSATNFPNYHKNRAIDLANPPFECVFNLSPNDIQKIFKAKTGKIDYSEEEIRTQYENHKNKFIEFNRKIDGIESFTVEQLTESDIELLVNLSSFAMNSEYFPQKSDQKNDFLSPENVLSLIRKMQSFHLKNTK